MLIHFTMTNMDIYHSNFLVLKGDKDKVFEDRVYNILRETHAWYQLFGLQL